MALVAIQVKIITCVFYYGIPLVCVFSKLYCVCGEFVWVVCNFPNYRQVMNTMLKQVKTLDEQNFELGGGCGFYSKCEKMEENLKRVQDEKSVALKSKEEIDPNFPPDLLELPKALTVDNQPSERGKALKGKGVEKIGKRFSRI